MVPTGKITQEEAISGIETGKWDFYVQAGGRVVDVIVATSRWGNKYIKTTADGEHPDNLLSLMECRSLISRDEAVTRRSMR